jgi:hypothetical protein
MCKQHIFEIRRFEPQVVQLNSPKVANGDLLSGQNFGPSESAGPPAEN